MRRPWRCARKRWPATANLRAPPRRCFRRRVVTTTPAPVSVARLSLSQPAHWCGLPRSLLRPRPTPRADDDPMTPTLRRKLEALAERREELERLLADPGVIGDAKRFRTLSREFSQLEPIATALADEAAAKADLAAAQAMRNDPELGELAEEEIAAATERLEQLDAELLAQMIPKDPRDEI